jgi:hypothetical protein
MTVIWLVMKSEINGEDPLKNLKRKNEYNGREAKIQ